MAEAASGSSRRGGRGGTKNKAGNQRGRGSRTNGGRDRASGEGTTASATTKGGGSKSQSGARPQHGREPRNGSAKPGRSNGRGRSRGGRHHQRQHQQQLRVYCSNGSSDGDATTNSFWQMHRDCRALRYKVHKPQSTCPKLLNLLSSSGDDASLADFRSEDGRTIDALVVVPDTKQRYLYVCRDTPLHVFEEDPRGAETKLRDEIFSRESTIDETTTGFKLSCAACLLRDHEPNGFCLVASPSPEIVDHVCDTSRSNKTALEAKDVTLHPDHAHFVARLPRSSLWNLQKAKTRAQTREAVDVIVDHLSQQQDLGLDAPERFSGGTIELGHHLSSVLGLTTGNAASGDDFWFVMGYDDGKSLELDLPGGKRHLGETSLEGAMRETREETSLIWEASWVTRALQGKKSDGGNRYFVLCPPPGSFAEGSPGGHCDS